MQMKTIPNTIFLSSQWMKRQICGPTKFCATIQDLPVSLTLTTIIPYSYYHYFSSFFLILPKPKIFKCVHAIKKWMTFKIESIYIYITYFLTLILLISRHNFYVFFFISVQHYMLSKSYQNLSQLCCSVSAVPDNKQQGQPPLTFQCECKQTPDWLAQQIRNCCCKIFFTIRTMQIVLRA